MSSWLVGAHLLREDWGRSICREENEKFYFRHVKTSKDALLKMPIRCLSGS